MEDLLERRHPVLTDISRLGREDDVRLAVGGEHDVGVAMHDLEAGHVRDSALEAAVLVTGDDEGIEPVRSHGRPHVRVAALELDR